MDRVSMGRVGQVEFFSPLLTTHLNTHMNYLILTPDGVGSTILQRLITMTLYLEGHTVTNTHELTNGIGLKDGIASKTSGRDYSQTLGEIEKILAEKNFLFSRNKVYFVYF